MDELLKLLQGSKDGGILIALVLYVLYNRGILKIKPQGSSLNGELKELVTNQNAMIASQSALTECVHAHVEESNASHEILKAATAELAGSTRQIQQDARDTLLTVQRLVS